MGYLTKVDVGDIAPDFTLPSQKGEAVTLSSFRGKKSVVLYFYPRTVPQAALGRRAASGTATRCSRSLAPRS